MKNIVKDRIFIGALILLLTPVIAPAQEKLSETAALKIAHNYLTTKNPSVKSKAAKDLSGFNGNIPDIIRKLMPVPEKNFNPGFSGAEYFSIPEFKAKYHDEHLYYFIPDSYNPEQPAGLFIFLSDCDSSGVRESAEAELSKYMASGDYNHSGSYVAVAPSLPENFPELWKSCGSADYISAVIEETVSRFNIDPDKVVLAGYSSGASGAYSLALRIPDRFSVILAHSGNWQSGYWKILNGTSFYIIHGTGDALYPGNIEDLHNHKKMDVAYARLADSLLTANDIEHKYIENGYGHNQYEASVDIKAFFEYMQKRKRSSNENHVIAATTADGVCQFPHNRWITILETGPGTIPVDTAESSQKIAMNEPYGEFDQQSVIYGTTRVRGGVVDAINTGNNIFVITTTNIKSFELWLNSTMVDFSRPVTVILNGREIILNARESLITALKSYERRRDWGLIYTSNIKLRP